MLTLAFAQIVWAIVFQWEHLTGGSNGILGIWPTAPFDTRGRYYLLTLALTLCGVLLLWRMLFAPFGYAMRAGRNSPLRAEAIGINVKRVHWIGFAIAGAVGGLAGALFAFAKGSISPETIAVGRSVDGMVMVLLGGLQTLVGPVVGASVFAVLQDTIMRQTEFWRALLGAIILTLVLVFPLGLVGSVARLFGGAKGAAMSVLSVRELRKSFGGVKAVDGVSFDVGAGEFLALIGPNGAGKSTCFNIINGQLAPDDGDVRFGERSIVGLRPRDIWRLGVGRTFQVAATFSSMTVVENIQLALVSHHGELFRFGSAFAPRHRERAIELLRQVGMADARRPALQGTGLWRRQARRARDRARQRSASAADGRADRRHGAARAQRADRADQAAGRRAQDFGAVHRALHGRGVRLCRPHPGAGTRRADRRRRCRDDPRQPGGPAGLSRHWQSSTASPGPRHERADARGAIGLNAWYGAAHILFDLSFQVGRGEVVALMGRNGAGKSTTIKTLMGLMARRTRYGPVLRRGHFEAAAVRDRAARAWLRARGPPHLLRPDRARKPRHRPPAATPLPGRPAGAVLDAGKTVRDISQSRRMTDRLGAHMSGGEQQMLTVARTLMGNPLLVRSTSRPKASRL